MYNCKIINYLNGWLFYNKGIYELMRINTELINHQTVDIFVQLIMYAFSSESRNSGRGGQET